MVTEQNSTTQRKLFLVNFNQENISMQIVNEFLNVIKATERKPKLIKQMEEKRTQLYAELSQIDRKQQRYLHALEAPLNASKRAMLTKHLCVLRKERRQIKGDIRLVCTAIDHRKKDLNGMRQAIGVAKGRHQGVKARTVQTAIDLCQELTQG